MREEPYGAGVDGARTWSTDDVGPRERLSYWVEAVCEAFFELRVDSEAGGSFEGSAHLQPLGPLGMIFMQLGHQHIERTQAQISRSQSEQFQLIQYRNMPGLVRQFGREAWVPSGGFTMVDSRHPFTIDNGEGQDALSIILPVDWLAGWVSDPADAVARVWPGGRSGAGALGALMSELRPEPDGGMVLPGHVASEQIGSMLALAVGNIAPPADTTPRNAVLIDLLRDTVRGACHQALGPEEVAAHHGISLRQLHYQLAAAGTSFGTELLRCRLEGARRMLADQRFAALPILKVAERWGFSDGSHFARAFRARFGVAPAAFRTALRS